jgi:tetratricopeptide (TPR) repeat protein
MSEESIVPAGCFAAALRRYNRNVRIRPLIVGLALLAGTAVAQDSSGKPAPDQAPTSQPSSNKTSGKPASDQSAPPGTDSEASSSNDTRIDISPPKDDAKDHPDSKSAVAGLEVTDNPDDTAVQEFHPWSPLKALKDLEVGDFYFKRKNYKAALERYKEALYYKDGDALASFRVAECEDKLGDKSDAQKYYEQYLKILPDGPLAKDAHASLERLRKAQKFAQATQ